MSASEAVEIVETEKVHQANFGFLAFPDTGLVGIIAAGHLVSSKKMREVGHIRSELLPPLVVVHNGEPKSPVRLFGNESTLMLLSEIPLSSKAYRELAREISGWARKKEMKLLISLTGVAVQNRIEIEKPKVFGLGSSAEIRTQLKSLRIPLLEEGFVAGPQAFILNECIENEVPMAILLAQSHSKFPDPGAAVSMLECLNESFGLDVEIESLKAQANDFRLRLRELMQRTQQSMTTMQKSQEEEIPALYR